VETFRALPTFIREEENAFQGKEFSLNNSQKILISRFLSEINYRKNLFLKRFCILKII